MNQVRKQFKCFRCDFHNNVKVPQYFKGIKCKRCHIFNYFNYIPNFRRRLNNHNHHNSNNVRRIDIYSNNDNNFRDEFFGFNNNDIIIRNPIINRNNNINNNNRSNTNTAPNSLINRSIININRTNNLINRLNTLNNNSSNIINNNQNVLHNNNLQSFKNIKKEESIIIPWLKKEKATEEIRKKYQYENCPICLEEITGDITITKCKHIFHYKCLAKNIKKYEKTECPICRSDVKTGVKKEVVNRVNQIRRNDDEDVLNQIYLLNIFSNNGGYQRNPRNNSFENNNIRLSQQRINSNNNSNNNRSSFLNFISNIFNMIKSCF